MRKPTENFRTQNSVIVLTEEKNYEFTSSIHAVIMAQSLFPRPRISPPLCPIKKHTQVVLKPNREELEKRPNQIKAVIPRMD